jgi:hypothetical protein
MKHDEKRPTYETRRSDNPLRTFEEELLAKHAEQIQFTLFLHVQMGKDRGNVVILVSAV